MFNKKNLQHFGHIESHSVIISSDKASATFALDDEMRNIVSVEIVNGFIPTRNEQWLLVKCPTLHPKMGYEADKNKLPLGFIMSNTVIDLKHTPRFFNGPKDVLKSIEIVIEPFYPGTNMIFTASWVLQLQVHTVSRGVDWSNPGDHLLDRDYVSHHLEDADKISHPDRHKKSTSKHKKRASDNTPKMETMEAPVDTTVPDPGTPIHTETTSSGSIIRPAIAALSVLAATYMGISVK